MSEKLTFKRAMRIAICVLIAACAVQTTALASGAITPRYPTPKISIAQWSRFFAEVRATPGAKCANYVQNQYVCDSSAKLTIWVFTTAGHPAHPAVSRGIMFQSYRPMGAVIGIDRSGHYAGDRAAFEKWMREFSSLDQRQVADWGS